MVSRSLVRWRALFERERRERLDWWGRKRRLSSREVVFFRVRSFMGWIFIFFCFGSLLFVIFSLKLKFWCIFSWDCRFLYLMGLSSWWRFFFIFWYCWVESRLRIDFAFRNCMDELSVFMLFSFLEIFILEFLLRLGMENRERCFWRLAL